MRIVYPRKTGRGLHCSCRGRRTLRRGGYLPLLLSKDLGSFAEKDDNVTGGTISGAKIARITEKVKNIRF